MAHAFILPRTSVLLALFLALSACKRAPEADPGKAPAETPSPGASPAPSASPSDGFVFSAPKAGEPYRYSRTDVLVSTLGEQPAAGHKIETSYELRPLLGPPEEIRVELEVVHVKGDAKQKDYHAKVNSDDPGMLKRITNGADTTTAYDLVIPFAFLHRPLRVTLSPSGRLLKVEGGDEIRKAMLDMHPPKPKSEPHYQKKLALLLSDEALASFLLPAVQLMPKTPSYADKHRIDFQAEEDRVDFVAKVQAASLFRARPEGGLRVRAKAAFAPSERASEAPPISKFTSTRLLKGARDETIDFDQLTPAFLQAAESEQLELVWKGVLDETEGEFPMHTERTIAWRRSDAPAPPPLPGAPASQPADEKPAGHP